ncbi:DUF898 domain-containing protein [Vibrio brasiliensis]|uniref:DUF898 domain-containing protein n=1 Tax=Vibrio brasiliensis TaxID=170652 RepID=UPI001EFC6DFB|nr:DUF898 domain-containing protein [Vibrio brasiliensis]MCG9752517.1 DUF898 domain-containing protein [Vibrio brasiliensis]MCG9784727.1 DUF898 domain-containing protein [Vibrio brasiliensis]
MTNKIEFLGSGRGFFRIWIIDFILSALTLGIYSVWARDRMRHYFLRNTQLAGDNFDYQASRLKALITGLLAFFIVVGLALLFGGHKWGLFYIMIFCSALSPWLFWRHLKLVAGMTSYRGITFSFNGTLKRAYFSVLSGLIVAMVTIAVTAIGLLYFEPGALISAIILMSFFIAGFTWLIYQLIGYVKNGYEYGDARLESGSRTSLLFCIVVSLVLLTMFFSLLLGASYLHSEYLTSIIKISLKGVGRSVDIFDFFKVLLIWAMLIPLYAISFIVSVRFLVRMVYTYVFLDMAIVIRSTSYGFSLRKMMSFAFFELSNLLLIVLTLGVAIPWVKVREYKQLISYAAIEDELSPDESVEKSKTISSDPKYGVAPA